MRNAVIPYAIIAVLGIVAVIVISAIGLNQQVDIAEGDDTEQVEQGEVAEGETAGDADTVYQANCAACHGADLTGGMGPDLTAVGADMSVDEIKDIVQNGTDTGMPAFPDIQGEELDALANWLGEQQ